MAASSYPTKMSLWALSWGIPPAPQHSCFCCWHGTRDEGQSRRRTSHITSVPCRTEMFSAHREVRALGHSHPSLNSTLQDHQQAIVSLFPAALTQLSGRISSAGKETSIRDLLSFTPTTAEHNRKTKEDTKDATSLLSVRTKGCLWWALTRGPLRQCSVDAQLNSLNTELKHQLLHTWSSCVFSASSRSYTQVSLCSL